MKPLRVVHVVRRYGPVGGMERYVWETTCAMACLGAKVTVLCEALHAPAPDGIDVHQLGRIAQRPRWVSLLRFSRRARQWLDLTHGTDRIVHSHERLGVHDITTFHGPPFATIFEREWWRRVSIRVAAQLWMERREVCARPVRLVVPVSELIRNQLTYYYPCIGERMANP
nr:glycosyltransferase [Burkholderiales bacterium]